MPADDARASAAASADRAQTDRAQADRAQAAMAELADLVLVLARDLAQVAGDDVVALTPTEAAVIRCIDRHPAATPSAVAEATGLHRSNLSVTLRSLEAKGMVHRSHDDRDRRSVLLLPTPLAHEQVARLRKAWAARVAEGLGAGAHHQGVEAAVALLSHLEAGLRPIEARRVE